MIFFMTSTLVVYSIDFKFLSLTNFENSLSSNCYFGQLKIVFLEDIMTNSGGILHRNIGRKLSSTNCRRLVTL